MICHVQSETRRWTLRALLAVMAAAILSLTPWVSSPAEAHGSTVDPVSRNYGCYLRWGSDHLNPDMETEDPMCWQAWQDDANAMWNWNGLYVDGLNGEFEANIPDNELCSAGGTSDGRYESMDTPGAWQTTDVDDSFTIDIYDQATHGADYLKIYVTTQGYDAETDALDWGDLELIKTTGEYGQSDHYTTDVTVTGRSGHHVLYVIWQASHMDQTYFLCSDITFS